jgi:hypothetical protein
MASDWMAHLLMRRLIAAVQEPDPPVLPKISAVQEHCPPEKTIRYSLSF